MKNHEKLITGASSQLKKILDLSKQGVYIYLDDENKACNKAFATMLGYSSPLDWESVKENFPSVFVASKSASTLVSAFQKAIEQGEASSIKVTWKKKNSGTIDTNVILVPIVFEGHTMALHFATKAK